MLSYSGISNVLPCQVDGSHPLGTLLPGSRVALPSASSSTRQLAPASHPKPPGMSWKVALLHAWPTGVSPLCGSWRSMMTSPSGRVGGSIDPPQCPNSQSENVTGMVVALLTGPQAATALALTFLPSRAAFSTGASTKSTCPSVAVVTFTQPVAPAGTSGT